MSENSRDYTEGNEGGCRAKDVHDEMRKEPVDVGGEETTTKKLMRPQTGDPEDHDLG